MTQNGQLFHFYLILFWILLSLNLLICLIISSFVITKAWRLTFIFSFSHSIFSIFFFEIPFKKTCKTTQLKSFDKSERVTFFSFKWLRIWLCNKSLGLIQYIILIAPLKVFQSVRLIPTILHLSWVVLWILRGIVHVCTYFEWFYLHHVVFGVMVHLTVELSI